jgi:SAM-dependent methyltransferase
VDKNAYGEAYFEGRSSNYWWTVGNYENFKHFPHWKEILKLVRTLKPGGRLLDVGCAYGMLVSLASKNFEAYGIDISRFAVKKSKRYSRGNIAKASATSIPFRDETFDAITVLDTLEHVSDLPRCLEDIKRALKENGVLLLQLPNAPIWRFWEHVGLSDETHKNNLGFREWKDTLSRCGFKVWRCFGMISYAFKKIPFFAKSEKAAMLFPEVWIIVQKE